MEGEAVDPIVEKCRRLVLEVEELEKEYASLTDSGKEVKKRIESKLSELRRVVREEGGQSELDLAPPGVNSNPDAQADCPICQGTGLCWQGPEENQVQVECPCVAELRGARDRMQGAMEQEAAAEAADA